MLETREPVPGCLVWHNGGGVWGLIDLVEDNYIWVWWDYFNPDERSVRLRYPHKMIHIADWPAGDGCLRDERPYLEGIT